MQYGCLKLVHSSKISGRLLSTGSEILTFGNHCSANFQSILDCFIPKFKLEYDDSENIKTDCVNAVFFNLHQIKCLMFLFWGHPAYFLFMKSKRTNFAGAPLIILESLRFPQRGRQRERHNSFFSFLLKN